MKSTEKSLSNTKRTTTPARLATTARHATPQTESCGLDSDRTAKSWFSPRHRRTNSIAKAAFIAISTRPVHFSAAEISESNNQLGLSTAKTELATTHDENSFHLISDDGVGCGAAGTERPSVGSSTAAVPVSFS